MTTPRLLSNRYELGETLGYGGMSEVHRGRDVRLGRDVAVKILRADLARDATFQERFRREAQNAAALNHPAIVAVYDTGETRTEYGPLPYIVMEYVDGRTLRDIVKTEGPLSGQRAMEVMADVSAALDFSHRHGIIHRDVKPANVMITKTGAVKVMDFGIARALADGQAAMTQTAAVIGTAQYLSPEQARGEGVDARSDVYASGCVLFELLTGEPPFTGDSPVAVAYQHVREDPKPPSALNPRVVPQLDAIVLKAMSKGPANRYQSAAEMRADLVRVLSGQRPSAPMVMTDEDRTSMMAAGRGTDTRGRHRPVPPDEYDDEPYADEGGRKRKGWLIAGAVVAIAAIGLLIWLFTRDSGSQNAGPEQLTVPEVLGLDENVARNNLLDAGFRPNAVPLECGIPSVDGQPTCSPDLIGRVVSTDPPGKAKAAKGAAITMRVGRAPGTTSVPDLSGKTREEAAAELARLGLVLGTPDLKPTDTEDPNLVTKVHTQKPETGTSITKGGKVQIGLGKLIEKVAVLDVINQLQDQATRNLQQQGLKVSARQVDSDKPLGTVVKQTPAAGERVLKNSTVVIEVSKGPQANEITVPDLEGKTVSEAEAILRGMGWTGTSSTQDVMTADRDKDGRIAQHIPDADAKIAKNGTIQLLVYRFPGGGSTTTRPTLPWPPNQ